MNARSSHCSAEQWSSRGYVRTSTVNPEAVIEAIRWSMLASVSTRPFEEPSIRGEPGSM